jgi:hypothetical protein
MNLFTWGQSPWGQAILQHISWDLFWASLFAGLAFFVAHASYMYLSPHRKRKAGGDRRDGGGAGRAAEDRPSRRRRTPVPLGHGGGDVHAAADGVPADRRRQVRVGHVALGRLASCSRPRSSFTSCTPASGSISNRSGWSVRSAGDEAEILREFGHDVPGPKPGKYPLGNRLYHMAIVLAGLAVVVTGLLMMKRVRTPLFTRDPYLLGDSTWGFTYVSHGLAGVALVGLVIAHVYFAIRPEKRWITRSMILGRITRREYLEHHDPDRWVVSGR